MLVKDVLHSGQRVSPTSAHWMMHPWQNRCPHAMRAGSSHSSARHTEQDGVSAIEAGVSAISFCRAKNPAQQRFFPRFFLVPWFVNEVLQFTMVKIVGITILRWSEDTPEPVVLSSQFELSSFRRFQRSG